MDLQVIVSGLPKFPGVYLFKDSDGEIIYAGKAKNLKYRVSSYFQSKNHSPKTALLVSKIASMDFIVVDNEVEALLLENKLIKQHSPKYNISLKDGKTYAYLVMTDESYPRLLTTRKAGKKGTYFGPYVDGSVRSALQELTVSLFKLRVCKTLPRRACLNYHIGLCTAPCIKKVSKEEYGKQAQDALSFLKGNTKEVLTKLEKEMKEASSSLKFEAALVKKRQIEAIHSVEQKQKVDLIKRHDQDAIASIHAGERMHFLVLPISKGVILGKKEYRFDFEENIAESFLKALYSQAYIPHEILMESEIWKTEEEKIILESYFSQLKGSSVTITCPQRGDKKGLVELARKNLEMGIENPTLHELKEKLLLPSLPRIIECFDISNLGSDHIVAGMVQWVDGKPNKSGYRKFRMKTVEAQDDFASMKEAVHRRYKRLLEENAALPNLIIIDGGVGQLTSALSSLEELGLAIPIIALAKENEEIYLPHTQAPLRFEKNGRMMLLLRGIRDSVHTFALGYSRKRREMVFREETKRMQH